MAAAPSVSTAPVAVHDPDLSVSGLLSARFPSPELVQSAAAMFARTEPAPVVPFIGPLPVLARRTVLEGRRFFVTVGPGTVGLQVLDRARAERRKDSPSSHVGSDPGLIDVDPLAVGVPVGPGYIAPLSDIDLGRLEQTRNQSRRELVLMPDLSMSVPSGELRPRAPVVEWSRKSRVNLRRCLLELDYRPMFARGVPAMITLTYPGAWEVVAPNGAAVKRHLEALSKRWKRRWGYRPEWVWKLELQDRGAPHFHLFVVPPADSDFRGWLSSAWADIVAHPDPVERDKHRAAGTNVSWKDAVKCRDPKRLAVYFLKHSAPGGMGSKEYQHRLPLLWRSPGAGPGRWWGYQGLDRVRSAAPLSYSDFVQLRRVLRRYSQSRVPVRVQRVNTTTGVISSRVVHRRRLLLDSGRMQGGWVSSNSGPAFAASLSRLPALDSAPGPLSPHRSRRLELLASAGS